MLTQLIEYYIFSTLWKKEKFCYSWMTFISPYKSKENQFAFYILFNQSLQILIGEWTFFVHFDSLWQPQQGWQAGLKLACIIAPASSKIKEKIKKTLRACCCVARKGKVESCNCWTSIMLNLTFCVIVVKLMVWNCKENLFEILEQYVCSR